MAFTLGLYEVCFSQFIRNILSLKLESEKLCAVMNELVYHLNLMPEWTLVRYLYSSLFEHENNSEPSLYIKEWLFCAFRRLQDYILGNIWTWKKVESSVLLRILILSRLDYHMITFTHNIASCTKKH